MEQQKENWIRTLLSFAGPCKGKMILSVFCAILSVGGGFVPFWAVYEILILFIDQTVTLSAIQCWWVWLDILFAWFALASRRSWHIFPLIPYWKVFG